MSLLGLTWEEVAGRELLYLKLYLTGQMESSRGLLLVSRVFSESQASLFVIPPHPRVGYALSSVPSDEC